MAPQDKPGSKPAQRDGVQHASRLSRGPTHASPATLRQESAHASGRMAEDRSGSAASRYGVSVCKHGYPKRASQARARKRTGPIAGQATDSRVIVRGVAAESARQSIGPGGEPPRP